MKNEARNQTTPASLRNRDFYGYQKNAIKYGGMNAWSSDSSLRRNSSGSKGTRSLSSAKFSGSTDKTTKPTAPSILPNSRLDTQKVVTFYRHANSTHPELRMIINTKQHSNISVLIEELTRALSLNRNEQQIFRFDGEQVEVIHDFEDGGSYYFDSCEIDIEGEKALTLVQEVKEIQSKTPRLAGIERKQRSRVIKVITSESNSRVWTVNINERKLTSFTQLLSELNRIIQPEVGRVSRLCTRKGRKVTSLAELFHGTDLFVAIISSIGMEKPRDSEKLTDDRELEKLNNRKSRLHKPSKYDIITGEGSHFERKVITVQSKTHVFDPPKNQFGQQSLNLRVGKLPEQKLLLEWIYGYNGQESRDNVHVLKSGELIYYVASVAVVYDVYRHTQRYYAEHTTKITCMALHPNMWYVATGQVSPESSNISVIDHIRIWNADYLNTLAILSLEESLTITCLTFSLEDNGRKLASIDTDGHNSRLLVWDWNARNALAKSQSYEEKEIALKFHPHSNRSLISAGKGHVFYWTCRGEFLEKYKGHFFGCEVPESINCLVYLSNGDAVTGDTNGNLHFWPEGSRKTKKVIKNAHKGKIQALCVMSHDTILSYGSVDKKLSLWETRKSSQSSSPDTMIELSGDHGDVTSIAVPPDHHDYSVGNMEIYLGTDENRILKGTFKTEFKPFIKGHAIETTSMATNPCENHFATAGLDCYVIYRNSEDHTIIWEKIIEQPATALGFYPYGTVLAVGTSSGKWLVLKSKDGKHIASFQTGMAAVSCISYSADGADIAVGTSTGEIHLFSVYDEGQSYRLVATIQGHPEKITAIDWSKDGMHFRTMTENYQQNVWNMEQIAETGDLKTISDIDWQMQKSTLSYNTVGIWKPGEDIPMICCDRLASRDLLCVGTEYGHIRLFPYPCSDTKSLYREYSTHVSQVNHVEFLTSQTNLVSSGKHDNTIMQWRIVFGDVNEQGIKTGIFDRSKFDFSSTDDVSSSRSTSLGHRRVRSSEPTMNAKIWNPFDRSISVSPRSTAVQNLDDDYPGKPIKLDRSEINQYMKRYGGGAYQRSVSRQKSEDFLREYSVVRPVSRDRKKMRSEGSLPKL